jgi:hypothetical protein
MDEITPRDESVLIGCEEAPLRGQQPESLRLCWRIITYNWSGAACFSLLAVTFFAIYIFKFSQVEFLYRRVDLEIDEPADEVASRRGPLGEACFFPPR